MCLLEMVTVLVLIEVVTEALVSVRRDVFLPNGDLELILKMFHHYETFAQTKKNKNEGLDCL